MGKVILLADCRCGGTVLRQTLDSHPHLSLAGELLHPQAPKVTDWQSWISETFSKYNGWHLQRYQIPRDSVAWSILANTQGLKVIDLRRENRIEQYASWKLAMATKLWHSRPDTMPKLIWDQTDCDKRLREWEAGQHYTDALFQHLPVLKVTFEQIADNFPSVLMRCQRFLGLPYFKLAPAMERMAPVDYSTIYDKFPNTAKLAVSLCHDDPSISM